MEAFLETAWFSLIQGGADMSKKSDGGETATLDWIMTRFFSNLLLLVFPVAQPGAFGVF